jgi:hypothetical protein
MSVSLDAEHLRTLLRASNDFDLQIIADMVEEDPDGPVAKTVLRTARETFRAGVEITYYSRQSRRSHPEGSWDTMGRWYPSAAEDADHYTTGIRAPSTTFRYSYMTAARSRKHIMALVLLGLDGSRVPVSIVRIIELIEHSLKKLIVEGTLFQAADPT